MEGLTFLWSQFENYKEIRTVQLAIYKEKFSVFYKDFAILVQIFGWSQ